LTDEFAEEETQLGSRFILLVLFSLVIILIGLFSSLPVIFVSVPVMLFVGFAILQLKQQKLVNVQFTRTLENLQINEEDACRVRLSVTNTGTSSIALLQVNDMLPDELLGDNTRSRFSVSLKAGESRNLVYEVCGNYYGEYTIGPATLSLQDPAGMAEHTCKLSSKSKLIVFPKTAGKLSGFTIGPQTTRPRPGEIPARRIGAGMDYFTTRQLLPGEPARRINWKASARIPDEDKLLSNEFTSQQVAETLIVLDCQSNIGIKDREKSIVAYSVRATMSIAERLLRDKNRVGLLAIGSTSERVSPAYGRRQYDKIAMTLCRLTPGRLSYFGGVKSNDISYVVRYFYPHVSQIVLISPLMDQENLSIAFDLARNSATFDLMILSPNHLDFPLDRTPRKKLAKSRVGRLALRLAELERKTAISRLESARAIVLDWQVSEPLEQVVAANRFMVARRIAQLANR
jgi:uncharacterized protein (DUF58 family)